MTTSHESIVAQAETRCLVLADIAGYTAYLRDTELEHANDVLGDLIGTIVAALTPTLGVAKLEGDAVFAYATQVDGSMLLDTVEQTSFSFRRRRRDIAQATVCQCNACRLIPRLDLKFVAHHGRFVRSRVAGGEELMGTDVVLVHRLLKNQVADRWGLSSYALLTEACVDRLELDPERLGLIGHLETYDEIGEVHGHLLDLEARWRAFEEAHHEFVSPDEAQFEIVDTLPAAPPVVWEAYTSPRRRLLWQTDFVRIDQESPAGRAGAGTVNHCMHGKGVLVEEILDWRPFDYYTHRVSVPMIGPWEMTVELRQGEDGSTETKMRARKLRGMRRLLWAVMRRQMMSNIEANGRRLRDLLEKETTNEPVPDLL